ncbi:MAG: HD domain-containing protein, partial [Candidatus Omnitrophica bacterium]|nr:HD domain-containing protein [Candidatus Omnitrophota bacterium]
MSDATLVSTTLSRAQAFARARGLSLYLVGGFLRDALLDRDRVLLNVDLAVASRALETARALAAELRGAYICLDEPMGSARIVVSSGEARLELDLSDFRGATIQDDLARRDFTVNAMALPLEAWGGGAAWKDKLLDPLGGRQDLAAKRLRACFPKTFEEDAVRILRAFRFSAELGFACEPSMTPLMREAAPKLAQISGERVRDELIAVFQTDRASWVLGQLNELGALDVLFPELSPGRGVAQGGYHHLDVFGHQLETVAQCDRMLRDFAEFSSELRAPLSAYAGTEVVERRSRAALIKLSGLFHDVGKPATRRTKDDGEIWFIGHEQFGAELIEAVTERLRLSNREADLVRHLVLYHLRPGHLSREPQLTRRAIFRFFRDLGEDGPACLLVWWADRMATRGPSSHLDQIDQQRARLEELLRAYFLKPEEAVRPPRLMDGHQLM